MPKNDIGAPSIPSHCTLAAAVTFISSVLPATPGL
ncbi:hypothetical protein Barb7_02999 [Bacteroidales bacterium Barb7]|nr:hypothetical protein Barb7_02999 [Bacteroidales bacterium Barb7]